MERWIFGYGSLIFRPGMPFVRRAEGWVAGWRREWWQGSPDHRGTPEAPGRVVTAVRDESTRLWGVAYQIGARDVPDVFPALDHREKGGYERHEVTVNTEGEPVRATMYVAGPGNPHFVGPAPLDEMAAHVLRSVGPSGPNVEYVLRLEAALREMGVPRSDPTYDLAARIHVMMAGDAS